MDGKEGKNIKITCFPQSIWAVLERILALGQEKPKNPTRNEQYSVRLNLYVLSVHCFAVPRRAPSVGNHFSERSQRSPDKLEHWNKKRQNQSCLKRNNKKLQKESTSSCLKNFLFLRQLSKKNVLALTLEKGFKFPVFSPFFWRIPIQACSCFMTTFEQEGKHPNFHKVHSLRTLWKEGFHFRTLFECNASFFVLNGRLEA